MNPSHKSEVDPQREEERHTSLHQQSASPGRKVELGVISNDGWTVIGRYDFDGHGDFWMKFLPEGPGIYRLKFTEGIFYVGQARSIHRRLGDYHQPGQGIESDHRIHRALEKYNGAVVEVITGTQFEDVSVRHKREALEIEALRAGGMRVLNGRPDCVENLQDRIEYHLAEIEKLKEKISTLTANQAKEEM